MKIGENDIELLIVQMEKMVGRLQDIKLDKLNQKSQNPSELAALFQSLEKNVTLFQNFNDAMFKEFGITQADLHRDLANMSNDHPAKVVFEKLNNLKVKVFLAYATFLRTLFDSDRESPLFTQGKAKNTAVEKTKQDASKKLVKKKYKNMNQKMKWKKM